jgi:hypothetical protein
MEALDIADARSDTYLQTPKKPVISAWAFLDLCQIAESLINQCQWIPHKPKTDHFKRTPMSHTKVRPIGTPAMTVWKSPLLRKNGALLFRVREQGSILLSRP